MAVLLSVPLTTIVLVASVNASEEDREVLQVVRTAVAITRVVGSHDAAASQFDSQTCIGVYRIAEDGVSGTRVDLHAVAIVAGDDVVADRVPAGRSLDNSTISPVTDQHAISRVTLVQRARDIGANEVVLDQVARGIGAEDDHAIALTAAGIARDDVAVCSGCSADRIVRCVLDDDTVEVADGCGAGHVEANDVSRDLVIG